MVKIFFENYADDLQVETELPLDGSLSQAIEIFHNLPDYDGSFIGLINRDGNTVQISKYDRFLFLVEIPVYHEQASYSTLFTYFQVMQLLHDLYKGFDPYNIKGLKFEQYLSEKATK
ncbi:hypothetical protein [uncultured Empedobacter sp.]|uniref:hypothetical protein n=1 Tax=Empedobacter stercoris TaxID=1628248 RepID=UPI002627B77B|nr:hypothetical protein [uncultured Empedobacter sp.]